MGVSEYASLRHVLNLVEMRILKDFFEILHLCVGTCLIEPYVAMPRMHKCKLFLSLPSSLLQLRMQSTLSKSKLSIFKKDFLFAVRNQEV